LGGLNTFYLYGGKQTAEGALATYDSLNMNPQYTKFLHDFSNYLLLGGGQVSAEQERNELEPLGENEEEADTRKYPTTGYTESPKHMLINKKSASLYSIRAGKTYKLYAIPAQINDRDCDIILQIDQEYPHGKILGARNESGFIVQKGYDEIEIGDKIRFWNVNKNKKWILGEEFSAMGEWEISKN
jgi:hypothetical protein